MTYTPVEFPTFGGLDYRQDAQETRGSVDLLNVALDVDGMVRTRSGTSSLLTAAANPTSAFRMSGNYFGFTTGSDMYIRLASDGSGFGSTATTDVVTSIVPWPGTSLTSYYARGASNLSIKKLVFTPTISAPAGIPTGSCVGVQLPDNRLVVGNAGNNIGRVAFSAAGDAETFGADDYVTLPSLVLSFATWSNLLFVFTLTGLFVFYGNSTDATGGSEFNYRLVTSSFSTFYYQDPYLSTAAKDGVYFTSGDGVYRTTGGPPEKISAELDPLFSKLYTPPYFTGHTTPSFDRVFADANYLYVSAMPPSTTPISTGHWYVYHFRTRTWTHWQVASGDLVLPGMIAATGLPRPIFASTESTTVAEMKVAYTSDAGTAIVSHYRSGFFNPGQPGVETVVREWLLDGIGTVTFKTAVDDATVLSSGASITLGTSPATARGRDRTALRGSSFSFQVGAASGFWSVSRVVANVRGQRGAGPES